MQVPDTDVAGGAMSTAERLCDRLRALAGADSSLPPPYGHAEFVRRRDLQRELHRRQRTHLGRGVAAAAVLLLLLLCTVRWHQPIAVPGQAAVGPTGTAAVAADSPALVRAGDLAARDALEERIALIDTMLSESRIAGAP